MAAENEVLWNSKKKHCPFSRFHLRSEPKRGVAGHPRGFTVANMRNIKGQKGILGICATAMICVSSGFIYADGESVAVSSSSDVKAVPTEEMGTGIFSRFPFHVSVSVRGGFDDNVTTSKDNRQESWFTNAGIALTYDFGSPRTQLSLQVGGGATYYWEHLRGDNQDYDVNAYVSLSLLHKVSPRFTINATIYATYQTEPDFTLALGLNRRSGNFLYTQDKFTATYLWTPRFATATSYTFGALRYDDSAIGLFQDRIENTFGNEFKFLLWPTTSLVAEYRFQLVNYDREGDVIVPAQPAIPAHFTIVDGMLVFVPFQPAVAAQLLQRDSTTHYVLGGFDHSFSPRFNASFRGGAEFREFTDANDSRSSPYFEGTLNYALGKNTSLSWTSRYAIEESDVLLNPSRTTFRTGLRAKHNITPRITANLGAYYQRDDYDEVNTLTTVASSFTEEAFDLAFSVRYAVTRNFGIEAGYTHTDVWSDVFLREYSRNRYWAGLNVIF